MTSKLFLPRPLWERVGVRGALIPVFLFFAAFAVYLSSTSPTIGSGDSGELAAVGATLGIAHSPGYPLFALTGKLGFFPLPWGTPAYKMNILSALFTAGAVALAGMLLLGELSWWLVMVC